ncbi:NAD(P)-dependent alcohol dehydrogenase [Nonomuraea rhodomycinica]|uniref:NAD(P)-dependent alcohol dehydrogenase n=1 Tax=Nonomuraea rhodomycinica TaxID=1712872 RepID=A0A7Y6IQ21_9ACTN|nr:NAD(P)-dependent alcohol dehydrogenase [Nonomuraea rhodomycinica]NUW41783.1 NAD(P)-dependent alcohol dehydrogenase [Nonomuraea rhodomycinica]
MKAIVQDVYGPAGVLRLEETDPPPIGDDEVLVRVRAAGVDPGVWVLMTGRPPAVRLMGFGLRRPKERVRGRDLAGTVEAVGSRVTRFRPGDEVHGTCDHGSFAEYAAAPERLLARKPAGLSFEEAAAVPVSGTTALQAVRDAGQVRPGHRVMVIGAGGGIGTFAVQIAKALGASVVAVCGPGKADLVRSLGAEEVIDYTREEVDRDGPRHDVIIDAAGCRPMSLLRRALTPRGTLVLAGGGHDAPGLLGGYSRALLRRPLVQLATRQRLRGLTVRESADDLAELGGLIESGAVRPVIGRAYPLAEAPAAIEHLAQGHPTGKIVLTV